MILIFQILPKTSGEIHPKHAHLKTYIFIGNRKTVTSIHSHRQLVALVYALALLRNGVGGLRDEEADPEIEEMWDTVAGGDSEEDQDGVRTMYDDNLIDDSGVDPAHRYGSDNENSPSHAPDCAKEGEEDADINELFKIGKKRKKLKKVLPRLLSLLKVLWQNWRLIFVLALQLPIDLDQFGRREQLKKSGLGKVIMFLSKSDEETTGNRKLAKELVGKWSRLIFNKSTRFEEMKNFDDERKSYEAASCQKGVKSGLSSSNQHASRPEASQWILVRPQSKVDPDKVRARAKQVVQDQHRAKMNKKLQQQLKGPKRKQLQATKLSVEGGVSAGAAAASSKTATQALREEPNPRLPPQRRCAQRRHLPPPSQLHFEIHKIIWRARSSNATRVALQLPEGLLMYSLVISDILATFAAVTHCFILGDVTTAPAASTTSPRAPSTSTSSCTSATAASSPSIPPPSVIRHGWNYSISNAIRVVKPELEKLGFRVLIPQSKPLSAGEVPLEAFMIANPDIKAFRYDPYLGKLFLEEYDHVGMKENRRKAIERAKGGENMGNCIGDVRQARECFCVVEQIECPRLSIDWEMRFKKPLLTSFEAEIALGDLPGWWERKLECNDSSECGQNEGCCGNGNMQKGVDYPMDYYAQDGGEWNSSYSKKLARNRGKNNQCCNGNSADQVEFSCFIKASIFPSLDQVINQPPYSLIPENWDHILRTCRQRHVMTMVMEIVRDMHFAKAQFLLCRTVAAFLGILCLHCSRYIVVVVLELKIDEIVDSDNGEKHELVLLIGIQFKNRFAASRLDMDIGKAITEYTAHAAIENLVLGASRHGFIRRLKTVDVPTSVSRASPEFCTIYVISKSKISSVRKRFPRGALRLPALAAAAPITEQNCSTINPLHPRRPEPLPDTYLAEVRTGRHPGSLLLLMKLTCRARGHNPNMFMDLSDSDSDISFISSERGKHRQQIHGSFALRRHGSEPGLSNDQWKMMRCEAEMRRLKLELQKTMDMYSTACKEAVELHRGREDEEKRLEEAARVTVEQEKGRYTPAMEDFQTGQPLRYRKYSIEEIELATDCFHESRKIGEGGYGPVYKCSLDHTPVAVKVLRPDAAQGRSQFQQEARHSLHPNMVLLLGACPEYGSLVYEYMANGSLEDRLFRKGNTRPLSWQLRYRIAAEIATGLHFLHQTKPEPLVHRDLKPAWQHPARPELRTFCYIDPEYQQTGMLGTKSDVYSLGVVLLQIITAKPPMGLTHHIGNAIEKGTLLQMLDPTVSDWPMEETLSFAKLAIQCTELRRKDRPDLSKVIVPELNKLRELGEENMGSFLIGGSAASTPNHSFASSSSNSKSSSFKSDPNVQSVYSGAGDCPGSASMPGHV
ncbi:hypothetical protein SASPL_151186 [Salvia splendens]|uniref:RING-type E3 ubiquitin transferase n=1 Tax=Salvia splendens TaxID=180675 RepID=A0A8X8Z362_SALSN|nr:hypothetical protein SASPL_151186 [Salvia splendens]